MVNRLLGPPATPRKITEQQDGQQEAAERQVSSKTSKRGDTPSTVLHGITKGGSLFVVPVFGFFLVPFVVKKLFILTLAIL